MTLYYGHWVFWTLPGMTKASSHNTFIYLHLLTCLLFDYQSLDFFFQTATLYWNQKVSSFQFLSLMKTKQNQVCSIICKTFL